jgi:hypothetical protein
MTTTGAYPANFSELGDTYEVDGIPDPNDRPASNFTSQI